MAKEEVIRYGKDYLNDLETACCKIDERHLNFVRESVKALEQQKPIEKFKNAKDHIHRLAGDYKCWDNRLTHDEVLELCHILEERSTQLYEIPKDYVYDTETKDFLAYRHKYTGEEIHIKKPTPTYTLQQESSEDCVSRQAVLDMATTIQTDDYSGNEVMEVVDIDDVKALPPVTPIQRWIPVSEKLPQMKEQVLCCEKDKVFIGCMVFEHDGVPVFSKSDYKHFYVTAWMPLPKPYREIEKEMSETKDDIEEEIER